LVNCRSHTAFKYFYISATKTSVKGQSQGKSYEKHGVVRKKLCKKWQKVRENQRISNEIFMATLDTYASTLLCGIQRNLHDNFVSQKN